MTTIVQVNDGDPHTGGHYGNLTRSVNSAVATLRRDLPRKAQKALEISYPVHTCSSMFMVDDLSITAIQAAYAEGGEFAAAVELRRRFPGIVDNAEARACARAIAAWQPVPLPVPIPHRPRQKYKPPRS